MKNLIKTAMMLGALVAVAALLWSPSPVRAGIDTVGQGRALNLTRACFPVIGDSAAVVAATLAAAVASGELNTGSLYMVRCETDAWVRFGAAAVTAAPNDWRINSGEVHFIATGGRQKMRHMSFRNVTADGDCILMECL